MSLATDSSTDKTQGAFADLRVLELTYGIPGPYATMFLADNGADVVKVESTAHPDPYRHDPGFLTVNRNKRSVSVSGEPPIGDPLVQALAAQADVVVVRSPTERDSVRALNQRAMILVVTDWGSAAERTEPFASLSAPSPGLVHAATGIAWNQQSYAEVPVDVVVPLAHYATGVLGAMAIAAGLVAASPAADGPAANGPAANGPAADGPAADGPVTYEVSLVAGAAAIQLGESRPAGPVKPRPGESTMGSKGRVACYRLVEAADGEWFFLACGTRRFYQRMLEVIGRTDLVDDPVLADPPWGLMFDEPIERLTPILDAAFATRPRSEWLQLLAAADVPAQPVLTRDEFLATSVVSANKMMVAHHHPTYGQVWTMGLPFSIADAPGRIDSLGPELGAHNDEVVADWIGEWPPTPPTVSDSGAPAVSDAGPPPDLAPAPAGRAAPDTGTAADGQAAPNSTAPLGGGVAPLAGLRVIDVTSFIAGPVIGRHLGMLGADVIKVEPPTGDPFRAIGPYFVSWNQAKRSIAIDLTTPEGQTALHQLITHADVLIENFRPGVAARLGIDDATVRALNPRLITLSSPGFGADASMADKPAFDPLIQALGGLMAAQGATDTADGIEPVFLSVPVHDLFTPMVATVGVLAALRLRQQTGQGQRVETSLAHSTMVAQAAEFTRYAQRPPTRSGGFDYPGPGHSWSEASDGTYLWHDTSEGNGERTVEVCTVGITGSELAAQNDLVFEADHSSFGPLVMVGQLISGAGPHPTPAPALNEHQNQIHATLRDSEESQW